MSGRAIPLYNPTWSCVMVPLPLTVAFAMDFDGDEANIAAPQSEESKAEMELMKIEHNLFRNGVLIIKPVQHAVVGAFLLTQPGVLAHGRGSAAVVMYFLNFLIVIIIPIPRDKDVLGLANLCKHFAREALL